MITEKVVRIGEQTLACGWVQTAAEGCMVDPNGLACHQCEQPASPHERLAFIPGIYHGSEIPVVIVLHRECENAWEENRLRSLAAEGIDAGGSSYRTLIPAHRWVRKEEAK